MQLIKIAATQYHLTLKPQMAQKETIVISEPISRELAQLEAACAVFVSREENRNVVLSRQCNRWEGDHSCHELTMETISAMLDVLRKNPNATDAELKQAEDDTVQSHGYCDGCSSGYEFHQLYAVRSAEETKTLSDVLKVNYPKIQEIADKLISASNSGSDGSTQVHALRSEIQ